MRYPSVDGRLDDSCLVLDRPAQGCISTDTKMLIDKLTKRIAALDLDLSGRTVLTEAASGAYVVTPLLAALAGAKVFAYTKDSRYGTAQEVFARTRSVIAQCGGERLDITLTDTLNPEIVGQADIITNSGHLRPLNHSMLKHAKDGVVIPLMFEAWEWRQADMDIEYIRSRGFKIGATNERHPDIDVFGYLGDMALKLIFDAGICPYGNRFLLLCNNDFGPYIARTLSRVCEGLVVVDKDENREKYDQIKIDWCGGFPDLKLKSEHRDVEAVIFTAYPFEQNWIGSRSEISLEKIRDQLINPLVLRFAGDIDTDEFGRHGVRFFPEDVRSGHMGVLPSAIGFDPIIRLQAGGLKAAQAMLSGQHLHRGHSVLEMV